jgi:hypothetical protein
MTIKSRLMRRVGHVAHRGKMRNSYKVLVGKSEGKKQLGRPRCRWEDTIIELKEIRCEGVDWIHLDQDRDQWWALVNTVMCEPEGSLPNELLDSTDSGEFLDQLNEY